MNRVALLALGLGLGLLALGSTRRRGAPAGVAPAGMAVWSLAPSGTSWCGLPIIRRATENYGKTVLEVDGTDLVWGWTPPGDLRAAQRYGKRLIADLELRAATKAAPEAGWTGDELGEAEQLADLVAGVTSHGFVPPSLHEVMQSFAKRGRTGYPQVYDSDRSAEPRLFLQTCLLSWQKVGFTNLVPLLGASAGADYLLAWLDECAKLGVTPHLWSLQRLEERGITCAAIGLAVI